MLDVHTVDIDVLCKRFNTDLEKGLTSAAAAKNNEKYGPNKLTPPATTPEWVKVAKNLFGGFSMLLWIGGSLGICAYIIQVSVFF